MKIYIDADGCPVINETIEIGFKNGIFVYLICDTAHYFNRENSTTITVDKGADSADFKLVNMISKGDIVITQDYGLAAMCLAKQAIVLNQNGNIYNSDNIDSLLMSRYKSKKLRNARIRIKGNSKRTKEQTKDFINTLTEVIKNEHR